MLQVNGKAIAFKEGLNMLELIKQQGLKPQYVAVEHNGQIIRRSDFAQIVLADGDRAEIVHFVGGG